jgi:PAS domain S-box-containing protein
MEIHSLLKRQLKKYLPQNLAESDGLQKFLSVISESYQGYEKDIELTNHAFSISEKEYHHINETLKEEVTIRNISIAKLKEAINHIDDDFIIKDENDDLITITNYIKKLTTKRKKVELELKENIKRITSLIGNLQTGVLVESEDRKIVFTNQTFCDLFGVPTSPRQMIGIDCTLTAEQSKLLFVDSDQFIKRVDELLAEKQLVNGELLYLVDGRIFERDFIPITLDNVYKGHLWNYTDITEKRRALESLAQSESRNRLIMNSALDAIITIDEKGLITFWNPQAENIFGWNEKDVLNKELSSIIMPAHFRAAYAKEIGNFYDTGGGQSLRKLIEMNALHKNGEEFPVELSVTPVRLGDKPLFCLFIRDISERKKSQNILAASEEKYRSIIANMNLGLIEVDNDEIIQYANQSFCEISGYDMDDLIGRDATNLFVRGDNTTLINEKKSLRVKGVSDAYEVATKTKRGELKWWLVSGAPRYNDKGEIVGSIGIHLDITTQKEIEYQLVLAREAAEQSSMAKEAFLANMSHEIRTPLNGIIGMIRELSKEKLTQKQYTYVISAKKASKHLLSIINNILDFSKIEAGELKLEQNHFSIQDVIHDVIQILGNQASEKGILIEKNIDPAISRAFIGDAARMRQVLINLTGNAIKFSGKGTVHITCTSLHSNEYYQAFQIKIKDSGIGMDQAYLKKIFTKFQQEDLSSSRKYGGSGLGLVITKELIEIMNGEIEIESKKDVGTEVIVRIKLPIGDVSKIEIAEQYTNNALLRNKSILLVEDNEMNRLVAAHALAPYELNITEVENGAKAVAILKKESFDLILMDLQMPVMGGLQATKIIRDELNIHIPIIALTANAFKTEIDQCIAAGMNNYIIKPFEEKDLIDSISKEIELYEIRKGSPQNEPVAEVEITNSLYDLTKLREMSRDNNDFVIKMLNLFVDTIPDSADQMVAALRTNDLETLQRIAHKLKPSIANLGIKLLEELKTIEKMEDETRNVETLSALVQIISDRLSQVVALIRANDLKK